MGVFEEQAKNIRDNFSHVAIYDPTSGDNVTLKVEFLESDDDQPAGSEGLASKVRREVIFYKGDLPAEPKRNETFSINGTTYSIKEVVQRDNWFLTVTVK